MWFKHVHCALLLYACVAIYFRSRTETVRSMTLSEWCGKQVCLHIPCLDIDTHSKHIQRGLQRKSLDVYTMLPILHCVRKDICPPNEGIYSQCYTQCTQFLNVLGGIILIYYTDRIKHVHSCTGTNSAAKALFFALSRKWAITVGTSKNSDYKVLSCF